METINQIRQGDVLLIRRPAPAISTITDEEGLRVPGERTGHAHVLPATVHRLPDGRRLLSLAEPTPMIHEEHAPAVVPAGFWEPVLQRQYVRARGQSWSHRFSVD